MFEILHSRRAIGALALVAGSLLMSSCATTKGHSSFTETDVCAEQTTTYELKKGQIVTIGVDDITFKNAGVVWDNLEVWVPKPGQLHIEQDDETEETTIKVNDIVTDEPVTVKLDEGGTKGQLIEGGSIVDFVATPQGATTELELTWDC